MCGLLPLNKTIKEVKGGTKAGPAFQAASREPPCKPLRQYLSGVVEQGVTPTESFHSVPERIAARYVLGFLLG